MLIGSLATAYIARLRRQKGLYFSKYPHASKGVATVRISGWHRCDVRPRHYNAPKFYSQLKDATPQKFTKA